VIHGAGTVIAGDGNCGTAPGTRGSRLVVRYLVALVLAGTVIVPSLARAFGASSMAAGGLVVICCVSLMFLALLVLQDPGPNLGKLAITIALVLALVILESMASFVLNTSTFNSERFFETYVYLVLFLGGAGFFALLARRVRSTDAGFAIRVVFVLLLLSGVAGLADISPFFRNAPSVLFFSENSHFALALLPFLLYMTVVSRKSQWFFPFLGLGLALSLQSLTLMIGSVVVAGLALPVRKFLGVAIVGILILGYEVSSGGEYYLARLSLSVENANLSGLIYLDGWERAYLNLMDYHGMGVGFQQLGFVGNEGNIASLLELLSIGDLARLDGSFVAAKLISEFGMLAIIALVVYLRWASKSGRWLRTIAVEHRNVDVSQEVFFECCFVMFMIDLFVRGTGYFSPTGFLFVSALMWRVVNRGGKMSLSSRQVLIAS
jgi:hypothetical protein